MADVQDLIERARELAALADDATPGPWEWKHGIGAPVLIGGGGEYWVMKEELSYANSSVSGRPLPSEEDKRLIAAAPDMARLLGEMANYLEALTPSDDEELREASDE
jgi:hypothetical protein